MNVRPIDANRLDLKDFWALYGTDVWESELMEWINERPTLSLNTLRDAIYQDAVAHGLWEKTEQDAEKMLEENEKDKEKGIQFFRKVAATELVLDEAEELFCEAWEETHDNTIEELADVVIQAFSTAGYLGIDIDAAIRNKMEVNKRRPWKHEKVGDV